VFCQLFEQFRRVRIGNEILGMNLEPGNCRAASHDLHKVREPKPDTRTVGGTLG
jgi:hypothetical protein